MSNVWSINYKQQKIIIHYRSEYAIEEKISLVLYEKAPLQNIISIIMYMYETVQLSDMLVKPLHCVIFIVLVKKACVADEESMLLSEFVMGKNYPSRYYAWLSQS